MNTFYYSTYSKSGFNYVRLNSFNPECFRYILLGRSDCIKEDLFKSIIAELERKKLNFNISVNYNGRITGIQCEDKGFIICDGTYPFEEQAITFGGCDGIISLETFQKKDILKEYSGEIVYLTQSTDEAARKSARFMNAAYGVKADKRRLEKENTDTRKISRYAAKLWSTHGCPPSGKVGVEKKVFLTVPTQKGVECADVNMHEYCDTAIFINDGYCGDIIVDRIRRYALSSGIDIISCQNFLDYKGNPDHVIMPALRFGVFKESKDIKVNCSNIKKVRSKRFYLEDFGENIRVRLQFSQRAYDSLIKEACETIKTIDKNSRDLDEIYSDATDKKALNEAVIKRLFS